jgi:hypothetical protein
MKMLQSLVNSIVSFDPKYQINNCLLSKRDGIHQITAKTIISSRRKNHILTYIDYNLLNNCFIWNIYGSLSQFHNKLRKHCFDIYPKKNWSKYNFEKVEQGKLKKKKCNIKSLPAKFWRVWSHRLQMKKKNPPKMMFLHQLGVKLASQTLISSHRNFSWKIMNKCGLKKIKLNLFQRRRAKYDAWTFTVPWSLHWIVKACQVHPKPGRQRHPRSAIFRIVDHKIHQLPFSDSFMGSGRPVRILKSGRRRRRLRPAVHEIAGCVTSPVPGSPCGIRKACWGFQKPNSQSRSPTSFRNMLPWLLFGEERKVNRTENTTSWIS